MIWLPILEYSDFHDVPRLMLLLVDGRFLVLNCPFDSELDDYAADYVVWELPADLVNLLTTTERTGPAGQTSRDVPVESIVFDSTRREAIHDDGLASFLR